MMSIYLLQSSLYNNITLFINGHKTFGTEMQPVCYSDLCRFTLISKELKHILSRLIFPPFFLFVVLSFWIAVTLLLCVPQASRCCASWCCCRSTSPGPRSAWRGWAWSTSWPACRPSWAPSSTTSSWTTRAASPSTTRCSNWTCAASAWSTRWVSPGRGRGLYLAVAVANANWISI